MNKGSYFISVKKHGHPEIDAVNGYTFSIAGIKFGMTNFVNGKKIPNHWTVTHLMTGCSLCYGNTREDAVSKIPVDAVNNITNWLTWMYILGFLLKGELV